MSEFKPTMQITHLRRRGDDALALTWADGHEGFVSLRGLRDRCPCAGCQGESVLFARYAPPAIDPNVPGRYQLGGADPVGNYGLKFRWADGHDQGIYTWELIRSLCECDPCLNSRGQGTPGRDRAVG